MVRDWAPFARRPPGRSKVGRDGRHGRKGSVKQISRRDRAAEHERTTRGWSHGRAPGQGCLGREAVSWTWSRGDGFTEGNAWKVPRGTEPGTEALGQQPPLGLARFQRCGRNIVAASKTPDGNRVRRGRDHRPGKKAWRVMSEFERAGGGETTAVVNRRSPKDRRFAMDRRKAKDEGYKAPERRQGERREKVERRRMIDPTTCERDYTNDEIEFMKAMDEYKRKSGRMFPTWSEVLEVVRALGYERPATAN